MLASAGHTHLATALLPDWGYPYKGLGLGRPLPLLRQRVVSALTRCVGRLQFTSSHWVQEYECLAPYKDLCARKWISAVPK